MIVRDDLVTVAGGGEIAGVSTVTMRMWAFSGRVDSERIGSFVYVKRADCERVRDERASRTTKREPATA